MNLKIKTAHFVEKVLDCIYPVRLGLRHDEYHDKEALKDLLLHILDNNIEQSGIKNAQVANKFFDHLPEFKAALDKDLEATFNGDPAAKSKNEIILSYPGFQAISCYRFANFLLKEGVNLLPRLITEYANSHTGIDIHPGAEIGSYLCIDHGTGIVIGETAVIGNHVKIYQGVTLGALSVNNRDEIQQKRHPTIGNNVIIYAQAIILGGETIIGEDSIIGGNVWITESVPPKSKIYYAAHERRIIKE